MEMLTKRYHQDVKCEAPYVTSGIVNCGDSFEGEVINRLAAYEDTGLEPKEIDQLRALKDAEEQRREGCVWCCGFCPDVTGDPHSDYRICPMCARDLRGDNHGT